MHRYMQREKIHRYIHRERQIRRRTDRQTDQRNRHPPSWQSCAPVSNAPCSSNTTTMRRDFICNALLICCETRVHTDSTHNGAQSSYPNFASHSSILLHKLVSLPTLWIWMISNLKLVINDFCKFSFLHVIQVTCWAKTLAYSAIYIPLNPLPYYQSCKLATNVVSQNGTIIQ